MYLYYIMQNKSCNFTPKGRTKNECYNTCLADNTGDCATYCNNVCTNCPDNNVCLWIKQNSNQQLNNYLLQYNSLTDKIIEYQKKQNNLFNSANDSNNVPQINLSKSITDLKKKRNILWNYLVNEYNYNTQLTEANYNALRNSKKNIKLQKKIIEKNNESIDSLTNLTDTKKRQLIINRNKYRKLELQYKLSKIFMFLTFIGILVLFLLKRNIINKKISLILYSVYLLTIIIFTGIYYSRKNNNSDDVKYGDKNFNKPTNKEIGTDSLLSNMKAEDKAKCLAISDKLQTENIDPDSVDIGNINRYINDTSNCNIVSSNTNFNDIYLKNE